MNSTLYEGFVEHARHLPAYHRFRYPIYFYGLDLDELPQLDRRLPLFGYNRTRPASIYDADYLHEAPGSIREKLSRYLDEQPVDSVTLITSARYFQYVFNPVSFYYGLDAGGAVRRIVVEVNNTFGERHVYVPEKDEALSTTDRLRLHAEKAFHVSPFNDISGQYEFEMTPPGAAIDIRVRLIKDGKEAFEARLWGAGVPMTAKNHLRMLMKHPALPHLTKPRILREAARLYFRKRLTYHDKPEPRSPMTIRRKRRRSE